MERVKAVMMSNLSDLQESIRIGGNAEANNDRINFVKWLATTYPNINIEIDPDKEYDDYVRKFKNRFKS